MRALLSLLLLVCLPAILAAEPSATPPPARPRTAAPHGTYEQVRLVLEHGITGEPLPLVLGFREGKLAALWLVMPTGGDQRLTLRTSSLVLTSAGLAGKVQFRTAEGRERPLVSAELALELQRSGSGLRGNSVFSSELPKTKPQSGPATGVVHSKPLPHDALGSGPGWPAFAGPTGDMHAAAQPALIDDLALARPVWKSEAAILTGYGNAPDSRYFVRALVSGSGGGGSSPVVSDGTVYIHHYAPNRGSTFDAQSPYFTRLYANENAFREGMQKFSALPDEAERVRDHFRERADDMITAIDAQTGATRWQTTLPLRSPNLQTHKHRGVSGVPLVHQGRLFAPNLAGRLYALEAATGAVLWEWPAFDPAAPLSPVNAGPPNPAPHVAGGNLLWARGGKLFALDPATGSERWQAPGGYTLVWKAGEKETVLTFAGQELAALDAATGKPLWKVATALAPQAPLSAVIAGDLLIGAPPPSKSDGLVRLSAWKLSAAGLMKAWEAEPVQPDENLPLTVLPGRLLLLAKQEFRLLDLASGKVAGQRKFAAGMHGPGSNAWAGVAGERLLYLPEGQHGTARLAWVDWSQPELPFLGGVWLPPNVETTAYNSQPIVYPVVAGRLFVRGGDAIYCYDLRR